MPFDPIKNRPVYTTNQKLASAKESLEQLLTELSKRELPKHIVAAINERIDLINQETETPKKLRKTIKKHQYGMIKLVEKELKIVPKNYYRNLWMGLGMSIFGMPMGIALGAALGNMAFLGIGLPIGMAIGIGIGIEKDKKVKAEGRQLNLEYEL